MAPNSHRDVSFVAIQLGEGRVPSPSCRKSLFSPGFYFENRKCAALPLTAARDQLMGTESSLPGQHGSLTEAHRARRTHRSGFYSVCFCWEVPRETCWTRTQVRLRSLLPSRTKETKKKERKSTDCHKFRQSFHFSQESHEGFVRGFWSVRGSSGSVRFCLCHWSWICWVHSHGSARTHVIWSEVTIKALLWNMMTGWVLTCSDWSWCRFRTSSEPPGLTDGPLTQHCSTEVLLLMRIMFWNLTEIV